MIKAGITGDDIYAIGELLRLLYNHPDTVIAFVDSEEYCDHDITDIFKGMTGLAGLNFTDGSSLDRIDVLFCCYSNHGSIHNFLRETPVPDSLRLIIIAPDNQCCDAGDGFVYGLPELNRRATCSATRVIVPGEMATAIELALLPLAKTLMLNNDVTATLLAGSSCFRHMPGKIPPMSPVSHFDTGTALEVTRTMQATQMSFDSGIYITHVAANFARGIYATVFTEANIKIDELKDIYRHYYKGDSFTFVVDDISMNYVIGTNKCFLHLDAMDSKVVITACMDNMMKGCAGQAIHNMNLLFNLEETTGLRQTAILI